MQFRLISLVISYLMYHSNISPVMSCRSAQKRNHQQLHTLRVVKQQLPAQLQGQPCLAALRAVSLHRRFRNPLIPKKGSPTKRHFTNVRSERVGC